MNSVRASFVLAMAIVVVVSGVGLTAAQPNELSGAWDVSDGFEDDTGNWSLGFEDLSACGPDSKDENATSDPFDGDEHMFFNSSDGSACSSREEVRSDFGVVNSSKTNYSVQWYVKMNYSGTARIWTDFGFTDGADDLFIIQNRSDDSGTGWRATGTLVNSYNITNASVLNNTRTTMDGAYVRHTIKKFSDGTFEFYVDGTLAMNGSVNNFGSDPKLKFQIDFRDDDQDNQATMFIDNVGAVSGTTELPGEFDVSGVVKDQDGKAISGATLTTNNSDVTDTTDANGIYNLTLANGTHKVNASHPDFPRDGSITVTVDGAALTGQDIILVDEKGLRFEVRSWMDYNETVPYTVLIGDDVVTDQATVTSSNSTVVTVNTTSNELEATGNNKINKRVSIMAEYQGQTITQNITVANKSLNNIGILPPGTWPSALIGSIADTTGSTSAWPGAVQLQWLLASFFAGAAGARLFDNGLAGIAVMEVFLLAGWTPAIGWIGNGLIVASLIALVYVFSSQMGGMDDRMGS